MAVTACLVTGCTAGTGTTESGGITSAARGTADSAVGGEAGSAVVADAGEPGYATVLAPQIEQSMRRNAIPGAVVLVRDESEGDWVAAFGTRQVGENDPISVEDVFGLADITATMTATVLLQLQEQGTLSLTDSISKYVDGVPGGEQITLEDLGEYRTGLFSYDQDPGFRAAFANDPQREWAPRELLDISFAHPPVDLAGGINYSKTNLILLGLVIEKVTGMPAVEAVRTMVFEPLGLDSIGLVDSTDTLQDPRPHGYRFATQDGTALLSKEQRAAAVDGSLLPVDYTEQNLSYAWTADGAYGNAGDVADYFQAIVDGPLVDQATRRAWEQDAQVHGPLTEGNVRYGFGIATHKDFFLYVGAMPGYNSFVAYSPDQQVTIVILTNLTWNPNGGSPAAEIFSAIVGVLGKTGDPSASTSVAAPPMSAAAPTTADQPAGNLTPTTTPSN